VTVPRQSVVVSKALAERLAAGLGHPLVEVLASVQTRGSPNIGGHEDLISFGATVAAAQRAYAQAGITAADVDVVELHDCFSMAEIVDSEDLGLVPRGQGLLGPGGPHRRGRGDSDQSQRRPAGRRATRWAPPGWARSSRSCVNCATIIPIR
jgi:hypothetical protein